MSSDSVLFSNIIGDNFWQEAKKKVLSKVLSKVLPTATRSVTAGLAAIVLAGCAALQGNDSNTHNLAASELNAETPEVEYRPIPAATMYSLLIAEMAGQRQRYDVSLFHYLDQARKTRDPNVAERALRIAQYVGAGNFAAEASAIWLEVEPNDPGAVQAAAQVALGQKRYEESLDLYVRLFEMTGVPQFDFFAAATVVSENDIRLQQLARLESLTQTYPKEGNIYYARAILEQSLSRTDVAVAHIDVALKHSPELLPAAIQKARILIIAKRIDEANDWLDDLHDEHPDNKQIALLRARTMLEAERIKDARDAFIEINHRFPNDPQIMLSLALLEKELGNADGARKLLNDLLTSEQNVNEAHYYLADMAATEENTDLALSHFRQVGESREFLPAQLAAARLLEDTQDTDAAIAYINERSEAFPKYKTELIRIETELLIRAERQEDAIQSLTVALEASPDNANLLYTRAMLAERMGDLAKLESDLRHLLSKHPDHAEALNALGYSLANKTNRFDEAEPLIEKALSLQPDNPAMIDSLGWLYFREGRINEAGPLLLDAWNKMKDHEIAAHLGEWYWATDDQDMAVEVWKEGLKLQPDSAIINETLERLGVEQL